MARLFLVLLSVVAAAAGAANLYLSGGEQTRGIERHADELLAAAARSFPLATGVDAGLVVGNEVAQRTSFQFTLADLASRGAAPDAQVLAHANRVVSSLGKDTDLVVIVATSGGVRAMGSEGEIPLERDQVPASVRDALGGKEQRGFTEIEGKLHRILAVPVSTGVLAVALPVSDGFAQDLKKTLGADVTFLHGGKAVASSLSTMERAELAVAAAGSGGGAFGVGSRPADYTLLEFLELPLFAPWEGTTRAVAIDVGGQKGTQVIHSVPTLSLLNPAVDGQKRTILLFGLVTLLGLFFAMIGGGGRKRLAEIVQLADLAERAAEGDASAQAPEYLPGDLGRLSRAMNRLASRNRLVGGVAGTAAAHLDKPLLGAAEEPPADVADTFPFGEETSAPPALEPRFTFGEEAPETPAAPQSQEPGHGGRFFFGDEPEGQGEPDPMGDPPLETAREADLPFGLSSNEPTQRDAPLPFTGDLPGEGGGHGSAPWDLPTRPLPSMASRQRGTLGGDLGATGFGGSSEAPTPAPAIPAVPQNHLGEAATTRLPEELLQRLATGRKGPEPEPAPEPEQDHASQAEEDDVHFREVFEAFLQLRQECGESSAGISFERFATKLRTNRAQLIEKYRCRNVRFTVYVKDGKAALKATPVR